MDIEQYTGVELIVAGLFYHYSENMSTRAIERQKIASYTLCDLMLDISLSHLVVGL